MVEKEQGKRMVVENPFFSSINFQLEDCSAYVFKSYLRRADTVEMQQDNAVQMSLISPLSNSKYFENECYQLCLFFLF